jgi:DsbC/DsbD-like thiol-disulfide interchange protein
MFTYMKPTRLFAFLVVAITALMPLVTQAQVKASLVGAVDSVQPGKSFTVALRLQHDPHWHTYWVNPGTGLTTNIAWTLPEGFSASPIQWPAPSIIKDHTGSVVGNGYEGDLLLPVTITPPANLQSGTPVNIKAFADWLMCEDVCMPGEADCRRFARRLGGVVRRCQSQ